MRHASSLFRNDGRHQGRPVEQTALYSKTGRSFKSRPGPRRALIGLMGRNARASGNVPSALLPLFVRGRSFEHCPRWPAARATSLHSIFSSTLHSGTRGPKCGQISSIPARPFERACLSGRRLSSQTPCSDTADCEGPPARSVTRWPDVVDIRAALCEGPREYLTISRPGLV